MPYENIRMIPKDLERGGIRPPSDNGLLSQISDNPFFTGGLGLAVLGAVFATSQRGLRVGALALRRHLLVNVELNYKDQTYPHLLQWIEQHHRAQALNRSSTSRFSLKAFIPRIHDLAYSETQVAGSHGTTETQISLVPGIGNFYLRYKNALLKIDRTREKSMDLTTGRLFETIRLTTLYSQKHILEDIISQARQLASRSHEGKLQIYTPTTSEWIPLGEPEPKRPLGSVVLDTNISRLLVADLRKFLSAAAQYRARGVPYRRGYLLHGPPGTGKTSFVQALAGAFNFQIAVLSLSERGLADARLAYLLRKLPPRTCVLIEDVDVAFHHRGRGRHGSEEEADDGYQSRVTMGGLLNALDGAVSSQDRLCFLTTNHVERLDPALVRPGRVDMTVYLGYATREQAAGMWDRFYNDNYAEEVEGKEHGFQQREGEEKDQGSERTLLKEEFLTYLEKQGHLPPNASRPASPAALQGLFLRHEDPQTVVKGAKAYFEELGLAA